MAYRIAPKTPKTPIRCYRKFGDLAPKTPNSL